ncbi:hydroxyisourate hydrolase [Ktedonospora formicarum]|uniref:5-hydroxyisourate hydrolase n=1 Tax=Ktedonospora formicarum TaxID=2778364 RepID=A0A8J3MRX0_9CHLR|nr:hydroxyisourate hydrolase [Ktedonospora formicarum]GHO46512.1 5-hydroxyisourate hydrolase [Ktedonospora formicarum]
MTGMLTTHVLDTMHGCPATDMNIELWRVNVQGKRLELLKRTNTNDNGRTAEPLLQGAELIVGHYELVFSVGDYFTVHGSSLPKPAFLDKVPIRFGIAQTEDHYHVPLLVSPWAYSTYRGS